MKRTIILFLLAIFGLLISCNKSKEQPNNTITIDQINMDAFVINNIIQENSKIDEPVEDIIEIFELDSINIILNNVSNYQGYLPENDTILPKYLPEKDTILKLTNKTLFEYNYSSYKWSYEHKTTVKIIEDSPIPFHKYNLDIGFGHTDISFYYKDDSIVMHLDYGQSFLPYDPGELSEEELLEYMSNNTEKLIFDAVFKKEPLPPEL